MIVTTELDMDGTDPPVAHAKLKFELVKAVGGGGGNAEWRVTGPRRLVEDWMTLNGYDLDAHPFTVHPPVVKAEKKDKKR